MPQPCQTWHIDYLVVSALGLVPAPLCVNVSIPNQNSSQGSNPEAPGVLALTARKAVAGGRVETPRWYQSSSSVPQTTEKPGQLKSRPPAPPSGFLTKETPMYPKGP